MTTHAMTVWLGPAAEEMTDDHRDRFARIWGEVQDRYPDRDDDGLRDAVLSAAVQYLLGECTLDTAAAGLASARAAVHEHLETAKQVALMAIEDGMTEKDAAKRIGLNRLTLRRAAGKM